MKHRLYSLLLLALATACGPPPATGPAPDGVKRVRIVHTNDFHGRLLPQTADGRSLGGSAVLAAHFDSAVARFAGPTLILSAGDDMQGTAVSNLSWGRATIAAHNASGYDAAAVGNHEFDWGLDTLQARVAESRFPWLAANVFTAGTRAQPAWLRPWVMIERDGVRTAVIGIALETTPEIVLAGRTAGLDFGPAVPAIDQAAREARAAGADFVVVTAHVGATCEHSGTAPAELSTGCRGEILEVAEALSEPVDLIVGGHTHRRVLTSEDSIPLVEAASYSTAYSVTDLERRGGRTVATRREVRTPFADEVTPDTAVARVVTEWSSRTGPVLERVGEGLQLEEHSPGDGPGRQVAAHGAVVDDGCLRLRLHAHRVREQVAQRVLRPVALQRLRGGDDHPLQHGLHPRAPLRHHAGHGGIRRHLVRERRAHLAARGHRAPVASLQVRHAVRRGVRRGLNEGNGILRREHAAVRVAAHDQVHGLGQRLRDLQDLAPAPRGELGRRRARMLAGG
ncbi:MAG TPA: metallophosphatase, partial [Longimicrobium sp.]|nr:metallophosphatase [Longimicrobium sp.]